MKPILFTLLIVPLLLVAGCQTTASPVARCFQLEQGDAYAVSPELARQLVAHQRALGC